MTDEGNQRSHDNVDTTLNVDTQVLDGLARAGRLLGLLRSNVADGRGVQ
jgi:hypothetical protein